MTARFLSTIQSTSEWPCTSIGPVWKLRRDQVIDMHGDFLSGVYSNTEMEGWTPGKNRPLSYEVLYNLHNNITAINVSTSSFSFKKLKITWAQNIYPTFYLRKTMSDIITIREILKKIAIHLCRTTYYRSSFFPSCVHLWNNLPQEIKECYFVISFKNALSSHNKTSTVRKYYYVGCRRGQILHTRLIMRCSALNSTCSYAIYNLTHIVFVVLA